MKSGSAVLPWIEASQEKIKEAVSGLDMRIIHEGGVPGNMEWLIWADYMEWFHGGPGAEVCEDRFDQNCMMHHWVGKQSPYPQRVIIVWKERDA